jgi:hypothetical protein
LDLAKAIDFSVEKESVQVVASIGAQGSPMVAAVSAPRDVNPA